MTHDCISSCHHITCYQIVSHNLTSHYQTSLSIVELTYVTQDLSKLILIPLLFLLPGFIGEGKSALTDEEITVLVSCADKDGNGTTTCLMTFVF